MPPFFVLISHGMAGAERCFFGAPVLCSLFISRGRAGGYLPPLFGDVILYERIGCLQNYTLRNPQSFPLAAGDEPLPYNLEIDFYTKIIFPTNLSFAICLFYALCAKNKESVLLNHSSSLFNFLSRKLAGYGVEPRKKRKRTGVGLRYPSEPVQMCKKRTSTSSKRLIICPILSHRFSLYLHVFTNLRP